MNNNSNEDFLSQFRFKKPNRVIRIADREERFDVFSYARILEERENGETVFVRDVKTNTHLITRTYILRTPKFTIERRQGNMDGIYGFICDGDLDLVQEIILKRNRNEQ